MSSLPRLTIPDLVADPGLINRLVYEGETLYVERKETDPKDGLGATIASFANMLGGWLLVGVTDDRKVIGYDLPGRVDLQDYVRDLLRSQVDPIPPFAAEMMPADGRMIGVVRVPESSDQPHITREGVIYRRTHGGKEPVKEARDIIAMARRGDEARERAARRHALSLISNAMRTPDHIYGEDPNVDEQWPLLEWIARATPYTITGTFADRALSKHAADLAKATAIALVPPPMYPGAGQPAASVEGRARGLYCVAGRQYQQQHTDMAIDAGGVVAARVASRHEPGDTLGLDGVANDTLRPLISALADVLRELDGYGRADVGLEVRGTDGLRVQWWEPESGGPHRQSGMIRREDEGHPLCLGGDLVVPASSEDVDELVDRWKRELARAARLEAWEPGPTALSDDEP